MALLSDPEFEALCEKDSLIKAVAESFLFLTTQYHFRRYEVFCQGTADYDYRDPSAVSYSSGSMEVRILLETLPQVILFSYTPDATLPGFYFDNRCLELCDAFEESTRRNFQRELSKRRSPERRLELLAKYLKETCSDILAGNIARLDQLLRLKWQSEK